LTTAEDAVDSLETVAAGAFFAGATSIFLASDDAEELHAVTNTERNNEVNVSFIVLFIRTFAF